MNPPKLLVATYGVGIAIFLLGLVLIVLNVIEVTELGAAIPLIVGVVILFGSKLLAWAYRKGAQS